jgi:K(+)-stimulated pyrophosphate-energized sodium pump
MTLPRAKGKARCIVPVLLVFMLLLVAAAAPDGGNDNNDKEAIPTLWLLVPAGAVFALVMAAVFHFQMLRKDAGSEQMRKIASYVRTGAMAYLRQQYKIVAITVICLSAILAFVAFVLRVQSPWVPFAFLTGAFFSGLSGFLGMNTATQASSRTAAGAQESLDRGLKIAFRSGAVMGLVVVGLVLLDISAWFYVLKVVAGLSLHETTIVMLCSGMGASTQALFARVGGGIFTKSADVGADLVGKVEAGIPEDDPRNPASIADNVGDNVGDIAGMGADLYESFYDSILATAALGVLAGLGIWGALCPMLLASVGAIFSVVGILAVRMRKDASAAELYTVLNRGMNLSAVLVVIVSASFVVYFLKDVTIGGEILGVMRALGVWGAIAIGLAAGVGIGYSTSYYTSGGFSPVKGIAEQAKKGAATLMIDGLAVGMSSTAIPVLIVAVAIILSFGLAGGFSNFALGLYGVSISSVGMLATLAITLATDAYGPIADNASGNASMSKLPPHVRERTDALDSLGNTTAAIGKGFAIGSAALTALALFAAYVEGARVAMMRQAETSYEGAPEAVLTVIDQDTEVQKQVRQIGPGLFALKEDKKTIAYLESGKTQKGFTTAARVDTSSIPTLLKALDVSLLNPRLLGSLFIGSMMVFFFCSMTLKAVGRAAGMIVVEVRRQFKEIVGLMDGTADADHARCVQIATKAAQNEMIVPSLIAIVVPVVSGLLLGVAGVMGLLAGSLVTGFVVAIMMANSGGAWDNAKKLIESRTEDGKGSAMHKAAVVGDTVGDPFKDTAGPSLNILLKLMAMVSIVFVGVIVKYAPQIGNLLGMK